MAGLAGSVDFPHHATQKWPDALPGARRYDGCCTLRASCRPEESSARALQVHASSAASLEPSQSSPRPQTSRNRAQHPSSTLAARSCALRVRRAVYRCNPGGSRNRPSKEKGPSCSLPCLCFPPTLIHQASQPLPIICNSNLVDRERGNARPYLRLSQLCPGRLSTH